MATTIKLRDVIRYAKQHGALAPLTQVGGTVEQPALDLCNDTLMDILTSPNDWRWNQAEMTMLVTCQNKQDYLFAGASAFVYGNPTVGAAIAMSGITVAGGVVTVNTLEPHRFKSGDAVYLAGVVMKPGTSTAYNSIYVDDGFSSNWINSWPITSITPTTFTFAASSGQDNGDAGGAPGITDFGWLASAYMKQMDNHASPQYGTPLQAVKGIQPTSRVNDPEKVCVYDDYGNGVLKIRFGLTPGAMSWGVVLTYQCKAPLKANLDQTWDPVPDNFIHLCRQGLVYRMYRYLNKTNDAAIEYQKFQQDIAKAQGFDDNEESDIHLIPDVDTFFNMNF